MRLWPPVMGICGLSKSGKTTLIEKLVPTLRQHGLRVAVWKNCPFRLEADRPGTDSDRAFSVGADVMAISPKEAFIRLHKSPANIAECLHLFGIGYDIVWAEGFREAEIPRIFINRQAEADKSVSPPDTQLLFHDVFQEWRSAEKNDLGIRGEASPRDAQIQRHAFP